GNQRGSLGVEHVRYPANGWVPGVWQAAPMVTTPNPRAPVQLHSLALVGEVWEKTLPAAGGNSVA
ncbi:MAG: hypothetical protein Q8R98_14370, partial [Rubrivivax sp.]|nr:hypothetical protein [Rubrivivax sp.]